MLKEVPGNANSPEGDTHTPVPNNNSTSRLINVVSKNNETCPIKSRRTKQNQLEILKACQKIIEEENHVTLRHLFYRLVSEGFYKKTEEEYSLLSGKTMQWRRNGDLKWSSFIDSGRFYHGTTSFDNLIDALENSSRTYSRNLWNTQPTYVEIWCEKDALISIISEVTEKFGIPVFPMRGFPSGSALHEISETIKYQQLRGKTVYIYYIGDHDPSGVKINETTVENLKEDHKCEFNFERIALTKEQIQLYNLPTRPTKKGKNPHAKDFDGESTEVDALSPKILQEIIRQNIIKHIDAEIWNNEIKTEEMEKYTLKMFIENFKRSNGGEFQ